MIRQFVVQTPVDEAELAADQLWALGVVAIEERATPDDGIVELWTSVGDDVDVRVAWPSRWVDVDESVADTWRGFAEPLRVSDSLVVCPAWVDFEAPTGVTTVRIEPGSTFGMGDHPTTRLSLAAVERLVRHGDRVLDVGCGSGVLSVAAAMFGAGTVRGIDIAPAAVPVMLGNAELNGVTVEVGNEPLAEVEGSYQLVLANILAPVLISLADDLRRVLAPNGRLVISGILADAHQHVLDALGPLRVVQVDELDGWVAVELTW